MPLTFMLHRYDHEPKEDMTVFLPSQVASPQAIQDALGRILRALDLDGTALAWQRSTDPAL